MKKILLTSILILMTLSFVFADTTSSKMTIEVDKTAYLKLDMETVDHPDFGLSSQPVDKDNPPVPIQESGIVSLSSDSEIRHDTKTLHGSGTAWAYWDIASPTRCTVTIKLEDAMKGTNGNDLDWCCYFNIDDTEYYLGKYDSSSSYQNTTITTLTGKTTSYTDDSYSSLYYGYGNSFTLYNDTNDKSVPFWRIDDVELNFFTDNAYPSETVPADVYKGTLVMELTTN